MKKFAATVVISLLGIVGYGQTLENVNLFNSFGVQGTPRYTAMGGAFLALGNDFSAMHLNPAGAAVYRYDNLGVAMRFQSQINNSTFLNTESELSTFRAMFENIGMVKKFGKESKMSFAFSYSKLADFSSEFKVKGINDYNYNANTGIASGFTLGEYWLDGAYGQTVGQLEINGLFEEASAASVDILLRDTTGVVYDFDLVDASANAFYSFEERGRHDEYTFNIAGAEADVFYWGLGIGIPTVSYDNKTTLSETGYADGSYFQAVDLVRNNSVNGVGVNLKLGFIFRPIQLLRFAASYQSPSWYNVRETYSVQALGFARDGTQSFGNIYLFDDIKYGLATPAIYRIGAATVIGKLAIFSADLEYNDPSKTTISGKGTNDYSADQDFYQANTNGTLTLKLGGELRLGRKLFLRAGYQHKALRDSSQEQIAFNKNDNRIYAANTYSAGIGYKSGDFALNLSYVHSIYTQVHFVHPYLAYAVDSSDPNNVVGKENANPSRSVLTNDITKGAFVIGFNVSF